MSAGARASDFAFGNVAIDDLVFADGTTRWAVPGGGALYAALGMALWCGRAAVVAPAGPDYPRERFGGLDFSGARAVAHTMRNWGLYESDGSRHFHSRRDSQPWASFSPRATELDDGPYPHCHIAPMPFEAIDALLDALAARGARTVSLDLHDRELAAQSFASVCALVARVDVFLPSRQDVAVVFPGRTPLDALRALRRHLPGVAAIGIKCDADGVLLHAAGSGRVAVVPAVTSAPVDPTGAGDAFCGGFVASFARDGDVAAAAARGSVAAAFALGTFGPWGLAAATPAEAHAALAALMPRLRWVAL